MKWLLITTATRKPNALDSNVGDEFARLGVKRLIRVVDPKADFSTLDKEDVDAWEPRSFDKAVVCGMPHFWSLPVLTFPGVQNCQGIWWWPRIMRGWPSACRENFLIMGVGHVFVDRILSLLDYVAAIQESIDRAWRVVVREPILDHPRIVDSVCPSAFCLFDQENKRELRLCNLMKGGGHFGYLTPDGEAWDAGLQRLSDLLRSRDFYFIAHNTAERDLAFRLSWPAERVFLPSSARDYLALYSRTARYFGNRLHGAAVAASTGAPVWAVSHDSRLGMVRRLGGRATRTPEATLDAVAAWVDAPADTVASISTYPLAAEYARMTALMRDFAAAAPLPPWTE